MSKIVHLQHIYVTSLVLRCTETCICICLEHMTCSFLITCLYSVYYIPRVCAQTDTQPHTEKLFLKQKSLKMTSLTNFKLYLQTNSTSTANKPGLNRFLFVSPSVFWLYQAYNIHVGKTLEYSFRLRGISRPHTHTHTLDTTTHLSTDKFLYRCVYQSIGVCSYIHKPQNHEHMVRKHKNVPHSSFHQDRAVSWMLFVCLSLSAVHKYDHIGFSFFSFFFFLKHEKMSWLSSQKGLGQYLWMEIQLFVVTKKNTQKKKHLILDRLILVFLFDLLFVFCFFCRVREWKRERENKSIGSSLQQCACCFWGSWECWLLAGGKQCVIFHFFFYLTSKWQVWKQPKVLSPNLDNFQWIKPP